MDGREGMSMPGGASSYFVNRGLGSPGAVPPPGSISSMQHVAGQQVHLGGGSFQLESLTSSMPMSISAHGASAGAGGSGAGHGEQVKRKRGRPRKYGPDGSAKLVLSSMSSATPISATGSADAGSGSGSLKRGRGRPPGTGRKQQLASLGEWVSGSAGMGFTPHIITIPVGEDVATKIMSFSQQGPRAVCILSATGIVSTVTLRQPISSGGTVTYENRSGGLSISLAYPDGRVIGGGVGGLLIAATPVQVIVGSFLYGGSKAKNKAKHDQDSGPEHELHMADMDDSQSMPTGAMANQRLTPSMIGGWPGSRQMDIRNAHIDIDLTRG